MAFTRALAMTVLFQSGLAFAQEGKPVASTNNFSNSTSLSSPNSPSRYWNLRQTPITEVVKKARAAVVNIHSEKPPSTDDFSVLGPAKNNINGMGTGIVIDSRGYLITNNHVVEDVTLLKVRLSDGTTYAAQVLARDPEHDLALLKVDAKKPLQVLSLGTATDLMTGETVVAMGNAFGYEHTVTVGVVSATRRDVSLNKEMAYKGLIQTDASINPGNSGGPLLNIHGDLVGVNVAIRAGAQGIGFAIPVDTMVRAAGDLLGAKRGGVKHGIGIRNEVRTGETEGVKRTAWVDAVETGGPSARCGIQRGDEILAVDGFAVSSSLDLERSLLDHAPGDKVAVQIRRDGSELKKELTLDPGRPETSLADLVWRRFGLKAQGVGADLVTKANSQLHGGMLILEVRPESIASRAGFQKGDILVGLHQWEMITLDNIAFVLNHPELATFQPVRFFLIRSGSVHKGSLSHID